MTNLRTIEVTYRHAAIDFKSDRSWAAISISTRQGEHPELQEENRAGLLQMVFNDTCHPDLPCIPFDSEMADKILLFAQEMSDRVECLLVHCEAGVSRSPAVAAVLHRVYIGDDSWYFSKYRPNTHVYQTLMERAKHRGLIEAHT